MDGASSEPAVMPLDYLREITNGFSEERKLGSGSFGKVYLGVHPYGEKIAVKMLHDMPGLDEEQFQNEFKILTRLKHQNIVRLVGYCHDIQEVQVQHQGRLVLAEKTHRALCLEYMSNGSLDKYLSDECDRYDWQKGYRMIKGICQGLNYLHNEIKPPIYHLDLKPANVLLDENMIPRISDFGMSRLFGDEQTRTTKSSLGTIGYLPPEYITQNVVSRKFDIFSLGVVIIKIMAGPAGYFNIADMSSQESTTLVQEKWTNRLLVTSNRRIAYSEQVKICIEIGLSCVQKDRHKRPTIQDIVDRLKETETKCNYASRKMALYLAEASRYFACTDLFRVPSKYAWSDYYEFHFIVPNQRIALVTNKRVILLQCLDLDKMDRKPSKILWDVPWEEVLALEPAKAGYQRPSHVIIHLKNFRRSENFVRLIKCSVDEEREPQAVLLCSSIQKMWRSHQTGMKVVPLKVPSGQRPVYFASDDDRRESARPLLSSRGASSNVEHRLINHTVNFQKMWSSEQEIRSWFKLLGKQVADDGRMFSIWRPLCPSGYVSIGDVAHVGIQPPHFVAIYKNVNENFVLPLGYDLVWRNCAEDYRSPVSLWQPRPPEGYVALGCVAVSAFEEPPLDCAFCVNERFAEDAVFEDQIVWASSDAYPWGCYIYQVQSSSLQFMALRLPKEQSEQKPKKIMEAYLQGASETL